MSRCLFDVYTLIDFEINVLSRIQHLYYLRGLFEHFSISFNMFNVRNMFPWNYKNVTLINKIFRLDNEALSLLKPSFNWRHRLRFILNDIIKWASFVIIYGLLFFKNLDNIVLKRFIDFNRAFLIRKPIEIDVLIQLIYNIFLKLSDYFEHVFVE